MDDRIHAWLDGELPFEALTAQERSDALALEATVADAADRLRAIPTPDLASRVMAELPRAQHRPIVAGRPSITSRLRAWADALVPARGFGFRPVAALATLALILGFGLGQLVSTGPSPDATADAAPHLFVRFELAATGAADVRLAGSFSDWEASYELTPIGPDRWTVTLALEPGVHDYVFVVDGDRHVVDPYAPRVPDGFGGYNSRLALLTPAP